MTQPSMARVPETANKTKNIVLWVIQALLAAMFLMAGGSKLAGTTDMVQLFDAVGQGQWFRYVTGVIEVGSAILLLIPGRAAIGSVLLSCTMAGAILTHLTILHNSPALPVALLVGALIVLWGRSGQLKQLGA